MKKVFLVAALLSSSLAFGHYNKRIEVYKVVAVTAESPEGWTTLKTASGLDVYVRCKTADFDDSFHDRVGGFTSEKDCREFVSDLSEGASAAKPIGIQIGPDFTILIEKEMQPNHNECGSTASTSTGSPSKK